MSIKYKRLQMNSSLSSQPRCWTAVGHGTAAIVDDSAGVECQEKNLKTNKAGWKEKQMSARVTSGP